MPVDANLGLLDGLLSSSLSRLFAGKICASVLQNRGIKTFEKDEVIYDLGDEDRNFFFIRRGVVKVGTITETGQELIYDIRKDGSVVGELCAAVWPRRDRAVALEQSTVVPVPFDDILAALQQNRGALSEMLEAVSRSLLNAYEQASALAAEDTLHRLVRVLLRLASRLGRRAEQGVELETYLTQEELAQMVAASRERVSTAMNALRQRGLVRYARRGHLLIDVAALESSYPGEQALTAP